MTDKKPAKWVCTHCGSANVWRDAWVDVNTDEVVSTFDHYYCPQCDGETSLVLEEKNNE